MICKYHDVCTRNIGKSHWTCLKKLAQELTELESRLTHILCLIDEKQAQIYRFYCDACKDG